MFVIVNNSRELASLFIYISVFVRCIILFWWNHCTELRMQTYNFTMSIVVKLDSIAGDTF